MNAAITFASVRVVVSNPDGKDDMLGVLTRDEALAMAAERGQDLVLVSPDAVPPVCKIINYDKLRYEMEKKEKLKRKNQKTMEIKEVKLSYKIDVHDYEVRKRAAVKFLLKGDKVKATIRFKGREMAHKELGQKTLSNLMKDCETWAKVDQRPMMEGRQMMMVLSPLPEVVKQAEKEKKERMAARKRAKSAESGGAVLLDEDEDEDEDEDDDAELALLNNDSEDSEDEEDEVEDSGEAAVEYDLEALSEREVGALIVSVGERVRKLKADGTSKAAVAAGVDELLSLKARYQELTSQTWEERKTKART